MAKKKRAPKVPKFPPDIFWISPDGKYRDVIGHLTSIQAKPEVYGLHAAPESPAEIQEALDHLFEQGWVRGRTSSGVFSFQMERPRGTPMGNSFDFTLLFSKDAVEVEVDFWDSEFKHMAKSMSAVEFLAQKFPARWGLGRTSPEEVW